MIWNFGDLIDNQNHDIHVIGSWIIPNSDIKDILNLNLPVLGRIAQLLDSKLLQRQYPAGNFCNIYISA